MARTREDRLTGKGPKRILAIDAGGARALLGAGLLFGLEARLRRERNDAQFRLWDHFDLIGGVSSGAVLAAALSAGASVEEACLLLEECGPPPEGSLRGDAVRRPKFDQHRLQETLQQAFGGALLGDPRIRTGLAILVKPLGEAAPELWSNAPGSSTAERSFAEAISASLGGEHLFDGRQGYADAALAAPSPLLPLLRFAISPRGLGWRQGADHLALVSLGAGRLRPALPQRVFDAPPDPNPAAVAANVATRAAYALEAALFDAQEEALAAIVELTIGEGETATPGALARFSRIDVDLTPNALEALGFSPEEIAAARERKPATGAMLALWRRIGETAGGLARRELAPAVSAAVQVAGGSDAEPAITPGARPMAASRRGKGRPAPDGRSRLELLSGVWGPK